MKKKLFILFLLASNFVMSQTIEWTNPDKLLQVNYESDHGQRYSVVLFFSGDSIKQLAIYEVYVGEEFKKSNPLSFEKYMENIEENSEICNACILRDGDRFVQVSRSTSKPLENVPVITINILFENRLGVEKWELNQHVQFGYFGYDYADYQVKSSFPQ